MKVVGIIWLRHVADKLAWKHGLSTDEVEQVFSSAPRFRHMEAGDVDGEDLYAALSRTAAGRYLIVFFVYKASNEALIVSARDMTRKERKAYGRKTRA